MEDTDRDKTIAYSCAADSNFVLCVMNEDSTGKRELLRSKGDISNICWSPDGKQLLCSVGNDAAEELAIITVKDGRLTPLTSNHFRDTYPTWSPDGNKILFISDMDGDLDIYYMELNN